jgi:hypothetical protein
MPKIQKLRWPSYAAVPMDYRLIRIARPWVILAVFIAVTSVAAWVVALRSRRRIGRALGKKASDRDLTSLATWMKVDEAEQGNKGNRPTQL